MRWLELLLVGVSGLFWMPQFVMWVLLPFIVVQTMVFDTPATFSPFPGWWDLLIALGSGLLGLTGFLAWLCLISLIFFGPERLARSPGRCRLFLRIIPAGLLVIVVYVVAAMRGLNEGAIFSAPGPHGYFTLPILFLIGLRYTIILSKRR